MKTLLSLFVFALIGLSGYLVYTNPRIIQGVPIGKQAASPSPILVGADKDIHGCIGSAGYSWCEPMRKCLRTWEEPCLAASPEYLDNQQSSDLIPAIKQALIAKHGQDAGLLKINVSEIDGAYAKGGASGEGGGGMWFAAKSGNQWQLVWDGNGIIFCEDINNYPDFPVAFIPECYDKSTGQLNKR